MNKLKSYHEIQRIVIIGVRVMVILGGLVIGKMRVTSRVQAIFPFSDGLVVPWMFDDKLLSSTFMLCACVRALVSVLYLITKKIKK